MKVAPPALMFAGDVDLQDRHVQLADYGQCLDRGEVALVRGGDVPLVVRGLHRAGFGERFGSTHRDSMEPKPWFEQRPSDHGPVQPPPRWPDHNSRGFRKRVVTPEMLDRGRTASKRMSWSLPMGIALLVTALSISSAIGIHWLALRVLWRYGRPRLVSFGGHGIGILVLGCIVAHLLEIGVFALGIFITAAWEGQMHLADEFRQKNLDLWYYSAAFYTS